MKVSLNPLQRWVWRSPRRRALRLLQFAEVEADGGRDIARAGELTNDPRLRQLFIRHALDERRHAEIFRGRGIELLAAGAPRGADQVPAAWLAPGERGLDDVRVERDRDAPLLAFLHLSEHAAAQRFAQYADAVGDDHDTREVFRRILKDEAFHMTYTRRELARVAPSRHGWLLWRARLGRLWKGYLRLAAGLGNMIGSVMLVIQYFVLLPPFAWIAKRAERREPQGWRTIDPAGRSDLTRQY